jgi:hypothetical protein
MPRRFQWVLGMVIAVAGLCNASPASAARPVITHSVDEGTITNIQDCGTAHVDITFRDEITTRAFYDDGVLVKVVRSHRGLGTLLLVDDQTGSVLATETGSSPSSETFDLVAMTVTFNGSFLHNNVPGLGRVAHAGGQGVAELLSFDPETGAFETGDILFTSAKMREENFDVDWCEILRAQL